MTPIERGRMYRAQLNPDEWIVRVLYTDEAGRRTIRYISPTRMLERKGYLRALCLAREEVRTFALDRISDVALIAAHKIQMPVPVLVVPDTASAETEQAAVGERKVFDRKIGDRKIGDRKIRSEKAGGGGVVVTACDATKPAPVVAPEALPPLVNSALV